MDRITQSLLEEFVTEHELVKLAEDKQFEHLACSITIARSLPEQLDTSEVVVGAGGDTGIDGVGIIVNGSLVTDPEDIEEFVKNNGYLEANFIFVQAERTSGFDAAKIGTFSFGVQDFFSNTPSLPRNEFIKAAAAIMSTIYKHSSKLKKGKPSCKLYYVTTGRWTNDANLEARRTATVTDLQSTNLFGDVDFVPVDADRLQRLYRESKNSVSCEFEFSQKTVIPKIEGVKEAYLGLIPASEFIKLIQDEQGEILKSVFYDNVRDWQDYNDVNKEMRDTLTSQAERARFALMNNGVTIITKTLVPTGNKFFIEDYQIVNGCQTSHVLFGQRTEMDNSVMVPLRLIATNDENITAAIIKATNRQTPVTRESLLAMSDFQRKIEDYFASFDGKKKLFYERRSRQYNSVNVEKTRIVPPNILIRSFAAMFLEEPHLTSRNYKALLDRVGKDIFGEGHRLEPYYVAAYANYRLDCLFRSQLIDGALKRPARYQLLLALRLLLDPSTNNLPLINSHEMKRYCEKIMSLLWDSSKSDLIFKDAEQAVHAVAKGNLSSDNLRTVPFTQELQTYCTGNVTTSKQKKLAGKV